MTIFDLLKALGKQYNVSDEIINIILMDRNIESDTDPKDIDQRTMRLLRVDLLFNTLMFTPSTTSSQSFSHGGFQKTLGSRSDAWINKKLDWCYRMYALLDDDLHPNTGRVTFTSNPVIR